MSSPPIVAALSGGVDSAVAAALLVEAGHRVVGMTMRLYDASGTPASVGGRCCGPRDIEDARRVCQHLDIPFYVVDFETEFSRRVVDDFVDKYLAGETPNPCVRCNQHIKFSPLLQRARQLGAEKVVTGHYARLTRKDGYLELARGRDHDKDQSYFLFSMPLAELDAVLFPLGDMTKEEVRTRARDLGLPNAEKAESQEICFVPDGDYAGFVEKRARERGQPLPGSGTFVDDTGAELGRHEGVHRFTVGQRKGLGNLRGGRPTFVLKVLPDENKVVVGDRESAGQAELRVGDVRWFVPQEDSFSAAVQVRHRATPVPATIRKNGGAVAEVAFEGGERVIAAPGQAAVFYDGDVVLGGGWIQPE